MLAHCQINSAPIPNILQPLVDLLKVFANLHRQAEGGVDERDDGYRPANDVEKGHEKVPLQNLP